METLIDEPKTIGSSRGKIALNGKIFMYRTIPKEVPFGWFDLEIKNEKGDTIQIHFNPRRQHLEKEIKRHLKLYKWIK
jgi:hypothetical protein